MKRLLLVPVGLALVGLLVSAPGGVLAQVDPLTVVRQALDANNRDDVEGLLALVTDDYVQEGGACESAPGGRCVGKQAFRQAIERGPGDEAEDEPGGPPIITIASSQVSGNTVTARLEVRFDPTPAPLRAAGVERVIELGTFEVRGDKLASARFVRDLSDPQTAIAVALFESEGAQQPQPAPPRPPGPPAAPPPAAPARAPAQVPGSR